MTNEVYTVDDALKAALHTVHDFVYLQGSAPETLPPLYISFMTAASVTTCYDNSDYVTKWRVQTVVYGVDPVDVKRLAKAARKVVKNAGFTPIGKGYNLMSGNPEYTGWIQEFYFIENERGIENG